MWSRGIPLISDVIAQSTANVIINDVLRRSGWQMKWPFFCWRIWLFWMFGWRRRCVAAGLVQYRICVLTLRGGCTAAADSHAFCWIHRFVLYCSWIICFLLFYINREPLVIFRKYSCSKLENVQNHFIGKLNALVNLCWSFTFKLWIISALIMSFVKSTQFLCKLWLNFAAYLHFLNDKMISFDK